MIKKILLLILIISIIFIPNKKYKEITEYTSKEIEILPIYLLDNNNYVSKTEIKINSKDKIKELIDALIIDGPKEDDIPSGFKSIINENTKLYNYELKDNTLKLNFSKELLDTNETQTIEAIVYTMTEFVDNIIIYIEDKLLTNLKSGENLPNPLNRDIGINKIYNIDNLNNINKVTIYYGNRFNDKPYYIPVTKYTNDTRDKMTQIIDELNQTSQYTTNLMTFISRDIKLINVLEQEENLILEFNEALLDVDKIIIDEVIYTINDNYNTKNITFLVKNKEIYKKVLKS